MTLNPLFYHELTHLALSCTAMLLTFYLARREKKKIRRELLMVCFLGAILGGFFVDLDHLIDYLFAFGISFDFNAFFTGRMFEKLQKIHVYFHGWEYVPLLVYAGFKSKKLRIRYFLISLGLGLLSHLIFDTLTNNVSFWGYSFIYRLLNGFDLDAVLER